MTREDIIRMAREAGINVEQGFLLRFAGVEDDLERFAALIAAAEREKVAAWMIDRSYATGHGDTVEDLLKELEWQVRESEREACAKVCEGLELKSADGEWGTYVAGWSDGTDDCAAAIRARGQA